MKKFVVSLLFLSAAGTSALAQDAAPGACTTPDTIAVAGNARVTDATIRTTAGLSPRTPLNYRDVQRAIKALFATGQFDDVAILCTIPPLAPRTTLSLKVKERPLLTKYSVIGADRVDPKEIKDRLALAIGRPLDPGLVAKAVARADSLARRHPCRASTRLTERLGHHRRSRAGSSASRDRPSISEK